VRAVVSAASFYELTVTVPVGATCAPITVTADGLTGYANRPFLVTYAGSGTLDTASLGPRIDLSVGDGPVKAVFGDLDRDGRPDLVLAHAYDASVWVFRNLGTNGALSPGSFASPVILNVGGGFDSVYGLALGDFDGDGRLDIVVANRVNNNVSVFRNTSTVGSLGTNSFAPRLDFPAGASAIDVAVADLDGDGKPDIVTPNYGSSTVSVLRNLAIGQAISFAPKLDLAGAAGTRGVTLADLDGDGQPEIIVANGSGNSDTLSVFRNISSPGVLGTNSFGPRLDFPGGGEVPIAADFDGDGYVDVAVPSWQRQSVSIFRNAATGFLFSSNSLAPRVDLPAGANVHHLAFGDLDGDGKPDIAAVTELPSQLSLFKNLSSPGAISINSFGPRIDFPTGWNAAGVAIGDLDADGRPDIAFGNTYDDILSLYRNITPSFSPTNCIPAPAGLVAWWSAEGNPNDRIGTNNGVLIDGVTFGPGRVGQGFHLNGAGSYIRIPPSPSLNLVNEFTLELWYKPEGTNAGAKGLIAKRNNESGPLNYAISTIPGTYVDVFYNDPTVIDTDDPGGTFELSRYQPGPPPGDFHHVAATYRQITTNSVEIKTFIDGALVRTRVLLGNLNRAVSDAPVTIGASVEYPGFEYFQGTIDEVSLYNRALSTNEIRAIYLAAGGKCPVTPPPPCVDPPPALVSWWAGQGNPLDAGGNNHGTLAGNVTYEPGRVGQAFVLDGSADAVVVGNPTNLQLQDFTIETWMRRADPSIVSLGSHADALLFGYGSGGYGLGLLNDGRLFLTRVDIDNVTINNGITDTAFHHVAVTKSNATVVFYIDGLPYPAPPYDTAYTFSTVAAIGARADTMDDSFLGTIDEVSVYNRPLSAAEIQSIYNADGTGKCRTPIKPFILTQPEGMAAYLGDTITLAVVASGDAPLTYQWRLNGTNLAGQTVSTLTLANLQTNQAGAYSVTIANATDSVLSSNAVVTVGPRPPCVPTAPGIVSWWPAQTNAFDAIDSNHGTLLGNTTFGPGRVGQAFRFDGSGDAVRVGNPANLQLQDFTIETWIKRSDSAIATHGTHTTAVFFSYGSAGYGFGIFDDGRLFLSRIDLDNVTLNTGVTDTNNFHHVAVTKSNTTVVFYIDGVAFPAPPYNTIYTFTTQAAVGARGDTLDDGFLGIIDDLAVYNRALSAPEILAIYNADGSGKCKLPRPPVIVTQPASRTNYIGDTVTFTVSATGDPPLNYQWRFEGNNLSGRTTSSLVLNNVQTNNAGNYSVLVSNAVDSVLSSNALLTLVPRPPCAPIPAGLVSWWRGESNVLDGWDSNDGAFTGVPQAFSAGKVGTAFAFTFGRALVASDTPSLRLTNSISIEAWVNPSSRSTLPQTILAKLKLPEPSLLNQSSYFLGLTNNGAPLFILSPTGSLATARVLVGAQSLPTNQWSFVVATYDGTAMRLYVNGALSAQTNYSGGIFAGPINLGIGALPPSSILVPPFGTVWPFAGLIDEVSLYNRALTPDEIQAVYNSDLTGKCLAPPIIVAQPQSQAVPLGEDVLFSTSILGTRPLRYQWRFNGINLLNATNATLVLEKLQTNRVGNYSVFVTNAVGNTLSSNALLTLLPAPSCVPVPSGVVSWWPADNSGVDAADGNNVNLGLQPAFAITGKVAQAFNLASPVRLSGPAIFAFNSPSLNFGSNANFSIETWIKAFPSNTAPTFATILDKRTVTPFNGSGYSLLLNQGRLAFWLASAPTSSTNASMFTSTGPDLRDGMFHHVGVTLNRTATNGGVLYVDGQAVLTFDPTARSGDLSNSANLVIGGPSPIFLATSNSAFSGLIDELALYNRQLSPAEMLAIRQAGAAGKCKTKPFIITQPVGQRINVGSNVTFSVTAGGAPTLRYQWLRGTSPVFGATNSSLTFQVQPASAGPYAVRVTNAFGLVLSSNALLVVNAAPIAQNQQVTLNEDTPTAITLHATDPQADLVTYSILNPPTNGVLTGIAPNLIYSPTFNYNGPDRFTFKVNDGLLDSAPATVSITVLPINDPPVAVIQVAPLFTLIPGDTNLLVLSLNNTNAQVLLDGSASSDVENDPLTFTWFEGTNLLGSGMTFSNTFTANPHTVTLQVSDGQDTGSAAVTFEVVTSAGSVRMLYGMIQLSELSPQTARPLQATLKAAASAFDSSNITSAINVLQAFQNKVRAQVQPTDPALAAELIAGAQAIIDSLIDSP
jgi:hypothetical protein